jgi:hypothetical protein
MSIAWSGRVTMARADWGDRDGSTVTFKLPMDETAEEQRNPFHAFTKRRKGRAGTRFMMACHTAREGIRHALYEDEAMLAGWNDSQTAGHTVKLWLCGDVLGHPFDGIDRKEPLIISLAELDDDQEIIDQKVRDRVEAQQKRPAERLSYVAAMLCKNEGFHTWIAQDERVKQIQREYLPERLPVPWEEIATEWIYRALTIKSRSELDKDPVLAEKFHRCIRKPFLKWQEEVMF